MNFQFYFEKLVDSKEFRSFINENKDAFLCSGFFAIDKKGNDNKQSLDYFVPSLNKMFSFKINNEIELIPVEDYGKAFKPEKIPDNLDFDFNYIETLIEGEMFEKKIKNKIEKLLLSLQAKDKKNYILGTIFISGLGLLKVKIDLNEKRIVDFEKMSFFDMIKIVKK
jgi:hypothetical protein